MAKILVSLMLSFSFGAVSALAQTTLDEQFKVKENEALSEYDLNKLALSEMQAGLTSKGLENERQAMRLYSPKDVAALRSALGFFGDAVTHTLTPPFTTSILLRLLRGVTRIDKSQLISDCHRVSLDDSEYRHHCDISLIPIQHRLEFIFKALAFAAKTFDVPTHFAYLLLSSNPLGQRRLASFF